MVFQSQLRCGLFLLVLSGICFGQEPPTVPFVEQSGEPAPIELDRQLDDEPAEWLWFDPDIWTVGLEVGANGTDGNANTFSFRTASDFHLKTEDCDWRTDLTYAKTLANSLTSQHYAIFNSRVDWLFDDSPWTPFSTMRLNYDEFKAFNARILLNSGMGYRFVQSDRLTLTGRVGSGYSREFGGPADQWVGEARFGVDLVSQLTKKQSLRLTSDFYPAWEDFSDYRMATDFSWEIVIDEEANLSLKLAVIDQYDSTPHGFDPNDLNYAMLLLWRI